MRSRNLKIAIVGASGHGRVVADLIARQGIHQIIGFLDCKQPRPSQFLNIPVLGSAAEIANLYRAGTVEAVALGVGHNFIRERLYKDIRDRCPDILFPSLVHPSAVIGEEVEIGAGAVMLAGTIVGPGSVISEGALLNTASSLDHDSKMDRFSSLAPGAHTGGQVLIGARSTVGMGAVIKHGTTIGPDTVIGMGAVVTKDISASVVAFGNPAKVIRSRSMEERYL